MPPLFKKAADVKKPGKPDNRGKIAVRIFLLDERNKDPYPVAGNLREDIFLEDATVGEVAKLLNQTLFGPGEKLEKEDR